MVNRMSSHYETRCQYFCLRYSPPPLLDTVPHVRDGVELPSANHLALRKRLRWLYENTRGSLRAAFMVLQGLRLHLSPNPRAIQKHGALEAQDHEERQRADSASR